jgi:hypothetical protein
MIFRVSREVSGTPFDVIRNYETRNVNEFSCMQSRTAIHNLKIYQHYAVGSDIELHADASSEDNYASFDYSRRYMPQQSF